MHTKRNPEAGLSILEMCTVIAIMGILFAIAVPAFRDLEYSFNRSKAIEQFDSDLRRAQATSLSQGARGILSPVSGTNTYTIGVDYAPYSTTGVADEIIARTELPKGITLTTSGALIFDSRGCLINVDGVLTSTSFSMTQEGKTFSTADILANGFADYH